MLTKRVGPAYLWWLFDWARWKWHRGMGFVDLPAGFGRFSCKFDGAEQVLHGWFTLVCFDFIVEKLFINLLLFYCNRFEDTL